MGWKLRRGLVLNLPRECGTPERLVALEIADWVWDNTRRRAMSREELCLRTGMGASTIAATLAKLAAHGLELRVVLGTDKQGKPLYAVPGTSPEYQVPAWVPLDKALEIESLKGLETESLDGQRLSKPRGKALGFGRQALETKSPNHLPPVPPGQNHAESSPGSDSARAQKTERAAQRQRQAECEHAFGGQQANSWEATWDRLTDLMTCRPVIVEGGEEYYADDWTIAEIIREARTGETIAQHRAQFAVAGRDY